jgi:hypothetical protein
MTALSNATKAAALDAIVDRVDAGSGAGKLQIFTAAYGSLLAEFTLDDPAFGAATVADPSVATAAGMPKATTGAATGTAGSFRVVDSDNVMMWEGTGATAVNTSAAMVILTNLSISTGQTVNLVSMTMSFAGTLSA